MATMIVDGVEVEMTPEQIAALPSEATSLSFDSADHTFKEETQWQSLIVSP